ncbi:insulinase family protein [Flammeovirga pectinis]|uniref:Insulinase family protein n=1 Tax=Flammeovirga pectinis TaxID=2494373 RepID=A0A3S9NXL1_9BACT|nr:insulinase family protein [Flammeovirga pectinis]AZQ60688.1 insulinase family protein [Flammeovirga pectinis]
MKNIREEKGLSYGIHSSFRNEINQGYFLIASDVKKDLKDLALEEIYKEIDILASQLVSEDELTTVKNYMTGNFVMSINSNLSLLEITKSLYKKGLSFDYYDSYVSRIQSISSEDIKNMTNKYLKGDLLEIAVG